MLFCHNFGPTHYHRISLDIQAAACLILYTYHKGKISIGSTWVELFPGGESVQLTSVKHTEMNKDKVVLIQYRNRHKPIL